MLEDFLKVISPELLDQKKAVCEMNSFLKPKNTLFTLEIEKKIELNLNFRRIMYKKNIV